MAVEVVPYSQSWPAQFDEIARDIADAVEGLRVRAIEHVGSTAVPGLAAKPVIDVDIVVERQDVDAVIDALARIGYTHVGDLGLRDREALEAPDDRPRRNVYVCVVDSLHLRNHIAVRNVLRRDEELRERYATVKLELAKDPEMTISRYITGKSAVIQDVLSASNLSDEERRQILRSNEG